MNKKTISLCLFFTPLSFVFYKFLIRIGTSQWDLINKLTLRWLLLQGILHHISLGEGVCFFNKLISVLSILRVDDFDYVKSEARW